MAYTTQHYREWRANPASVVRTGRCPRCEPSVELDQCAYSHLLGLYLGDGCVSALPKGVYSLRITCDAKCPHLIEEVSRTLRRVRPEGRIYMVNKPGCVDVQGMWKHWPCLFPQHGPGPKHTRSIRLAPWQQDIVTSQPEWLLRGLFHSDGCRIANWTVRSLSAGPKRYEYPRYFFSNESTDILRICGEALDQLGVRWTTPRRNVVSVARKESVAILDAHVGPKS